MDFKKFDRISIIRRESRFTVRGAVRGISMVTKDGREQELMKVYVLFSISTNTTKRAMHAARPLCHVSWNLDQEGRGLANTKASRKTPMTDNRRPSDTLIVQI